MREITKPTRMCFLVMLVYFVSMGKSALNHHLGQSACFFSKHLKQTQGRKMCQPVFDGEKQVKKMKKTSQIR